MCKVSPGHVAAIFIMGKLKIVQWMKILIAFAVILIYES